MLGIKSSQKYTGHELQKVKQENKKYEFWEEDLLEGTNWQGLYEEGMTIFIIIHIYTTSRYSGRNYTLTWLFYLTSSQQISNGNFITSQIWCIFQPHIFNVFQCPFQSFFTFCNFCFIWWFTFQLRH